MTDEFKGYPTEDIIWFTPEDLEKHDKEIAEQIIDEIPDKHYETDGNGTTFAKTSLKALKDQLRKKYL